jgi:hypothetical protein
MEGNKKDILCEAVRPALLSRPHPIGLGGPPIPTSEAGLANGRPTQPPELFGVSGGVGLPGTGLWWKGTANKKVRLEWASPQA